MGRSDIYKKGEAERAFIWDAKYGMGDLTKLIPSNTGWKTLESAMWVNNKGWVVGVGDYYGVYQVFLLIPRKS